MLGRRDPTRLSPILAEAVEARVLAGELKIMQLMPADAVRFYREAVAMVPPDNPGLIIRTLDSWGAAAAIPDAGAAAPPWQRALELRESMLGAGHRETMTARDRLIGLFLDTGQTAAARALLEKSLAAEQQSSTPADEALTRRLGQLGLLLRDQGALADAPTWLQRALERLVKESDVAPIRLARDFGDLAAVRRALGDVAAAGQFQGRALEQFRRALGAQHPDLGPQLDIMAEIELAGGNGIAALDHLKEAEAIARTRFGDWHVRIAERLYAIGRMLRALGQIAEAETVLKQGLSMHEAIQGQDSAELIFGLDLLGGLLAATDRNAEAIPLFERAVGIAEFTLGIYNPKLAPRLVALAETYQRAGQYSEADALQKRAGTLGKVEPSNELGSRLKWGRQARLVVSLKYFD